MAVEFKDIDNLLAEWEDLPPHHEVDSFIQSWVDRLNGKCPSL